MSPAAAAPALSAPVTSPPTASASVAAASAPRSALRLPITTERPAAAKRRARPRPWGPVPPRTATVFPARESGRVLTGVTLSAGHTNGGEGSACGHLDGTLIPMPASRLLPTEEA